MVINSTNINKTNRNLSSWQNSLNTKDTMTYDIENSDPDLGQAQKWGGVNGIPTLLSW